MNRRALEHEKKFGKAVVRIREIKIDVFDKKEQYTVVYNKDYEYIPFRKVIISQNRNEIIK